MAKSEILLESLALPPMFFSNFTTSLQDNFTANYRLQEDNTDVDTWPMMSSPWPMAVITCLYLMFVLRTGPAYMKTRSAFQLKNIILLYNGALVIFSTWWLNKVLTEMDVTSLVSCGGWKKGNELEELRMNTAIWFFSMSKFVELLDTVFFVLRKKQNQVSFLHVYHHTNMTVFTWAFLKYIRGDQIMMIGIVNTAVHAIMYSYYFISALGPKFKGLLWFKPIITWVQIGQFIFLIGYLLQLLMFGCNVPRRFVQFSVLNTFSFLLLFLKFYQQTYKKAKQNISNSQSNGNIEKVHQN